MATINEANSLKDLLGFMQTLKLLCANNPLNSTYLDQRIQQLNQPTYQIANSPLGRAQTYEYAGLLLTQLLMNDDQLLTPNLRLAVFALEQKIGPVDSPAPKSQRSR
ncbi:MAG: hypothetical protein WAW86_00665 [Gammaproteobacteria bacterium]